MVVAHNVQEAGLDLAAILAAADPARLRSLVAVHGSGAFREAAHALLRSEQGLHVQEHGMPQV